MWSARFSEDQLQTLKELVRAQGELDPSSKARSRRSSLHDGTTCPTRSFRGARSASRPRRKG